ncbi:MAG TPA: hypothetical protein VLM11_19065 [Streptosporangiaceae bacterium]|nr:hypothetical protein [Streptosporangiaceae bacterium]
MSKTSDPRGQNWPGGGYGPPSGHLAAARATALDFRSRRGRSRPRKPSAARKNVVAFLAIAAVAVGGLLLANALTRGNSSFNKALALRQVEVADEALTKSSEGFQSAVQACSGQLPCVTGLLRTQAQNLATFNNQIEGISLTRQAASDRAALVPQDNAALQEMNQLTAAKSNVQYMTVVRTNSLQQDLKNAEADYAKLVKDLGGITS